MSHRSDELGLVRKSFYRATLLKKGKVQYLLWQQDGQGTVAIYIGVDTWVVYPPVDVAVYRSQCFIRELQFKTAFKTFLFAAG